MMTRAARRGSAGSPDLKGEKLLCCQADGQCAAAGRFKSGPAQIFREVEVNE